MRARVLTVTLAMAATGAGAAGTVAASAPAPKAEVARTVNVTVGDDFYRPSRLTVARGTRVRWRWRARDEHNVTVVSGPQRFHSPDQRTGTFTRTLRRAGRYRIVCTIHGQMMRIRVR
jgi:plastocyanin